VETVVKGGVDSAVNHSSLFTYLLTYLLDNDANIDIILRTKITRHCEMMCLHLCTLRHVARLSCYELINFVFSNLVCT